MEELNRSLFLAINASADASAPMRSLAMFLAQWLILCVPLLLAGLWLQGARRQRAVALTATLSIVFALGCNLLISSLWFHPRPFMLGLGQNFLAHAAESSFPSDHATVMFALAFGLILASLRKLGLLVLLLGALVGWARVYLGVHFPFDIAGSFLVSLISAWLVKQVLDWRQLGEPLLDVVERLYQRIFPALARRNTHL
ncbi:undecaprenyl-diphosphate phosphatase [Pseudomonas sp. FW306-02-F02-AA]|uniref:undecaprenyl-diphosphate phosphatase n=1 Tax=Pseudomonas fluorescens TaxID=294 RepID=A0A0N7GZR6_PSEFL|nr:MULTISPECIES: undecaprenyl-diphosphatase [Pseudomonas]ALI01084.1 phosphatidylglycerophosphatase [Pseudomonas fluorescens]PMZ01371.1 undecaprenyl-diphosphate phosphatase [Pseudomonas sp. FW306-02-F02-AB]PMZ09892.1 undecaprenyl-diphosphate phosphatase [Pseudomonas sp. FW306-02-H06C]PMZ16802.1 undecaprenyl-diphosphate phosphatase [Pseudomonas sp. FW306-02-F02-AA]PMZ23731.1 undecaprenyl-diphosphate phosphatase [Pseudomonas sp. FW306-02-F08-AA]